MKAAELVVACFLLFGACLVWPLLSIANRPTLILGVPALVVYLVAVWAHMVVARTPGPDAPARRRTERERPVAHLAAQHCPRLPGLPLPGGLGVRGLRLA